MNHLARILICAIALALLPGCAWLNRQVGLEAPETTQESVWELGYILNGYSDDVVRYSARPTCSAAVVIDCKIVSVGDRLVMAGRQARIALGAYYAAAQTHADQGALTAKLDAVRAANAALFSALLKAGAIHPN